MRITSCLVTAALIVLLSPAMAAPCTPGQRADLVKLGYGEADITKMCGNASALFETAYNAKESGDLRSAQQLFEQGLRIEPGNALGQRFLAEVKESLNSAQKLFEQGYSAKQSGDPRTARQLFEQGLAIDPGNVLGQKFLAEVKEPPVGPERITGGSASGVFITPGPSGPLFSGSLGGIDNAGSSSGTFVTPTGPPVSGSRRNQRALER